MKLFGEYLIERSVISKEDLVKALIRQLKGTPSITEIIFNYNLRTNEELFDIFSVQSKKKMSFIEAAKELGLWDGPLQTLVGKYISDSRTPLGEVLVQMGVADLDSITHALDEFLAGVEADTGNELETETTQQDKSIDSSDTQSQETLASSYCEYFNLDFFLELTSLISFGQTGSFCGQTVDDISKILHSLKGMARISLLPMSEDLITNIENKYRAVQKVGVDKMKPALIDKLEANSVKYINMLWSLKEDLEKGISEAESLKLRQLENDYNKLTGRESKLGTI
jgi:hypothetical protein